MEKAELLFLMAQFADLWWIWVLVIAGVVVICGILDYFLLSYEPLEYGLVLFTILLSVAALMLSFFCHIICLLF